MEYYDICGIMTLNIKLLNTALTAREVRIVKSILIKDTTREERERIVLQSLSICGGACDFCNQCSNIGGGTIDSLYQPYIDGEKEIAEINAEYYRGMVRG